jgi:hypothetical protein
MATSTIVTTHKQLVPLYKIYWPGISGDPGFLYPCFRELIIYIYIYIYEPKVQGRKHLGIVVLEYVKVSVKVKVKFALQQTTKTQRE